MRDRTDTGYSSDEERWKALVERDQGAENAFLYGVKTTGVYCRPTCASRVPNRTNVVFFANCLEAEKAGFRPCKRCSPNSASSRNERMEMILRACKLMEESEELPGLEDLAAAAGMSRSHFHRMFKEAVGVTPKEYAAALRMRRVQGGLTQGASVTEAIYDAGFNSSSRFYERAKDMLGMTPTKYKSGAAGLRIRFAVINSFLGWTLVAATDQGICSIAFGDAPETMVEHLQRIFPKAELVQNDPDFAEWVSRVADFIETPARGLDLPLDIQGTAFQQRVWKALREIPPGSTKSYTELAVAIGRPKAARAVAHACASNNIAVAVPCHRIVRSSGALGGYRWGLERKRALLEHETAGKKGT